MTSSVLQELLTYQARLRPGWRPLETQESQVRKVESFQSIRQERLLHGEFF